MLRLLVILIPLCMLACADTDRTQGGTLLPAVVQLKVGDVVFRRGSGFTSQVVLMAEHGGAYSHVGIVADSAGVLMVVHAVPGEPDYKGDEDRVKMEKPEDFFASIRAHQGAVYRHRDSVVARKAAVVAMQTYRRKTLFDHDYDDSDTTKMYCTELITHAFRQAGKPLKGVSHQHLHLVGFESDCVLPTDLQHSSELKQVITF